MVMFFDMIYQGLIRERHYLLLYQKGLTMKIGVLIQKIDYILIVAYNTDLEFFEHRGVTI